MLYFSPEAPLGWRSSPSQIVPLPLFLETELDQLLKTSSPNISPEATMIVGLSGSSLVFAEIIATGTMNLSAFSGESKGTTKRAPSQGCWLFEPGRGIPHSGAFSRGRPASPAPSTGEVSWSRCLPLDFSKELLCMLLATEETRLFVDLK